LETTPSSPTLQAWANIAPPSILKLSLNRCRRARACTEVQRQGLAFGSFIETAESRILIGYVRAWLRDTFAAFTIARIQDLIEQSRAGRSVAGSDWHMPGSEGKS
jgi:hypothetical protein